jgi:nicotinate-nucleotide adenylyltransferase
MSMRIGLYFGSFNPIHKGHLLVAEYLLKEAPFDAIWFVPSPLNPHKKGETLIPADLRLKWVEWSIAPYHNFYCKSDEYELGLPSYTYKSVMHFRKKHPEHEFFILMGADNLHGFHRWQHADTLAQMAPLHVYARPGFEKPEDPIPFGARWYDAPLLDISATQIREALKSQGAIPAWIPEEIQEELRAFYSLD